MQVIKKLQVKFVIINMSIVMIMLCVIFSLVYNFTQRNLETESVTMMKSIASNPFQLGVPSDSSADLKLPFFTLQLGIDGDLVSANSGYYDLSDQNFLNDLIEISSQNIQEIGVIDKYNLRYCRVKMPMGTVLVFSDISSENNTLSNLMRAFIVIGMASFVLFLGISIILAKWAIKPVAKAWKQQKQFVADASHELKTPLTVIMTNTELLQGEEFKQVENVHFLSNIIVMSQQMRRLIEKMLILAKSDAQQELLCMSSFDMSKLVSNVAISFEGVFVEKGLSLESYVEPEINIYGNEEGIRQVVEILLDNAQKYSNSNSSSRIALYHKERRKCYLKVSNIGNPIPKEELKTIFQRFYRIDKARSRDGSFGLGLSIAENIILQHNGKVWAESKNGINSFWIELNKKK